MSKQILDALDGLDPARDEHWTAGGLPRVDAVVLLSGLADVKRRDIEEARPGFNRESAVPIVPETTLEPASVLEPALEPDVSQAAIEPAGEQETEPDIQATAPGLTPEIPNSLAAQRQALEDEREALRNELALVEAERVALAKQASELNGAIDRITQELDSAAPHEGTMESIQTYIARQNQLRAERVERTIQLVQAGVGPDEIIKPVSPIDAALARSRRRGAQRPAFPVKG